MPEHFSDKLREFLRTCEGRDIDLQYIRREMKIQPYTPVDQNLRTILSTTMLKENRIRLSGKRDGIYHVVKQVNPIPIFSVNREIIPAFNLNFPIDYDRHMPLDFAQDIILREGDLILISGLSNYGKTCMALNFLAQNLDYFPVLMGNEYTNLDLEPTPRFLNRLQNMDWVKWLTDDNQDRFTLLPVHDDHAEHIVKDRINIIDWINIESGEHFLIGNVLKNIKKNVGKGIAIVCIQKAENTTYGRGGQFTKDFTDCEILIDRFSDMESLLTIGKVKESTKPVIGNTYAFAISKGIRIITFREVIECPDCKGKKWTTKGKCSRCMGKGKIDK